MRVLKILIMCGLVLASATPLAFAMGDLGYLEQTIVGKPATDFTLNSVKGEKVNFTKYRDGKKAIIFFWATWCPHCRVELNRLNSASTEIAAKGIQLVVISLGEDKKTVQDYIDRNKINLDMLLDEDQSLDEPYQLIGVPTLFFVNEQGVIKRVEHAFPDDYESVFQ